MLGGMCLQSLMVSGQIISLKYSSQLFMQAVFQTGGVFLVGPRKGKRWLLLLHNTKIDAGATL